MRHVMCKLTNPIKDIGKIRKAFKESAKDLDIREYSEHIFSEPAGITCLLLLGESHYSLHSFLEEDKIMIDLFTCNDSTNSQKVIGTLAGLVGAKIEDVVVMERD